MKRYIFIASAFVAACSNVQPIVGPPAPPAPPPPAVVFPYQPSVVHVTNHTTAAFDVWVVIVGASGTRSGLGIVKTVPAGGQACLESAQSHGERTLTYAAVRANSPLADTLRASAVGQLVHIPRADSLSKQLITPSQLLSREPGLVSRTNPFDPAPATGFGYRDTIPWNWIVSAAGVSTLTLTPSDGYCL